MSTYEGSKMQERRYDEMFGKKKVVVPEQQLPANIPDGEQDWWAGSETFTRQQVLKILFTQRAMILNDIKRSGEYEKLPKVIIDIMENPRTPQI